MNPQSRGRRYRQRAERFSKACNSPSSLFLQGTKGTGGNHASGDAI
jgi:hypothetical protein